MEVQSLETQTSDKSSGWKVFGSKIPKEEIVYFSQVILIYIIAVTCIVNLSLGLANSNLWSSLLSGALGYILPAPQLNRK